MKSPNLPQKRMDLIDKQIKEAISKGEVGVYQTATGEYQFAGNVSGTIFQVFQEMLALGAPGTQAIVSSVLANMVRSEKLIPFLIPLSETYSPSGLAQGLSAIGLRWRLEDYVDIMSYAILYSLIKNSITAVPSTSINNFVVRKLMPIELGGLYANGNPGPFGGANYTAPLISGTNIRYPGVPQVSLAQGLNNNVVYLNTTGANSLQLTLILIYKMKDTTTPQNVRGLYATKNNSPLIAPDYSGNEPLLWFDWGVNNYAYAFVSPFTVKYNETLNVSVYSLATSNENLIFEGYIGYITGK